MYGQPTYYPNPTLQTTQQRLQMMEAQYPQFAANPTMGYSQPIPQQTSATVPLLKGRPVSNEEEANAAMIDFDELYKDGVALPCAISQWTVASGSTYTAHLETDLCLVTCCANHPIVTLNISGVTGNVNHTCVGMCKLA